jgi:hypothetical protein
MKKHVLFTALAAAMLASCANDENEPVVTSAANELCVSVNVLSCMNTRALKEGTSFAENDAIGVVNSVDPYMATYTFTDNDLDGTADTWTGPTATADKIYLSSETVTINAFYPASAGASFGTTNGDVFNATLATNETSFDGTGQTDYMYGTARKGSGTDIDPYTYATWPMASNAAADGTDVYDNKVDLYMHHALAKLSFVINKGEYYTSTGIVTSIKINKGTSSVAPLSGSFAIKISDGTIFTGSSNITDAISFTHAGVSANAYSLTQSATVSAYGLVIPATVTGLTITVTVDGKEMTASLPALPDSQTAWAAGKNYTYTLQINATELEVTNVYLVDWNAVDVNSTTPVDLN